MPRHVIPTKGSGAWGTLGRHGATKASPAESEVECGPTDPCVVLLIDVSMSMEQGNRLREAKQGARDYAAAATARGYAVGAVGFSGSAFVVAPPTLQTARIASQIAALSTLPTGTNVADAIVVGMALAPRLAAGKTLVLCSDGEPKHANLTYQESRDLALTAASRAKAAGFQIHALAIEGADVEFLRKIVSHNTFLREASSRTISMTMRTLAGLLPSSR